MVGRYRDQPVRRVATATRHGLMAAGDKAALDALVAAGGGGALVLISEQVLGAAAASVTFSSIPGTYRHLLLIAYGQTSNVGAESSDLVIQFNGDTAANYYRQYFFTAGASTGASEGLATASPLIGGMAASLNGAGWAGQCEIAIAMYAGTTYKKTAAGKSAVFRNTATGDTNTNQTAVGWNSAAAITSILLKPSDGSNFKADCTFSLYGLDN